MSNLTPNMNQTFIIFIFLKFGMGKLLETLHTLLNVKIIILMRLLSFYL